MSSLPLRKVFCLVEGNSSIVAHHLGRFSSVWFLLSFLMQENFLLPMPISSCFEEGPKIVFRLESLPFSDYNPSRLESIKFIQRVCKLKKGNYFSPFGGEPSWRKSFLFRRDFV